MKKFPLGPAVSFLVFLISTGRGAAEMPPHSLIPLPSQVAWKEGSFILTPRFSLALKGPQDARVDAAVRRFLARLEKRTSLRFSPAPDGSAPEAGLIVEWQAAGLPVQSVREDESYSLTVGEKQARLSAPNP